MKGEGADDKNSQILSEYADGIDGERDHQSLEKTGV